MLALYRRHRQNCKGSHQHNSRSSEYDERKKGWRRCECPIFVSGTLDKVAKRQNSGQWEWEPARLIAAKWEASGSWDRSIPQEPPQPRTLAAKVEDRTTIASATEAFLARCEVRGIATPTLRKYKTFIKQLHAFCDTSGYLMLDQLTVADMDIFYASWTDGKRARAKKLDRLKSFIKFCQKRDWIKSNIAEDLKAPEGSSIPANKTPFTDEELERIYKACDTIGPPRMPGPGYRPWGGEDAKDFIYLSIYTGLRISDVSLFNIDERLKGNDVFLRMHKTKKELYTWIPDWLAARLRARAAKHGAMIFRAGQAMNLRSVSERWRENLSKVFALAGKFSEPPHPHRFRHTFVRMLLEKGVPPADVAELIGDTEDVLLKHYAKWVPERQKRLSNILREALSDKPKPKLIPMPKLG